MKTSALLRQIVAKLDPSKRETAFLCIIARGFDDSQGPFVESAGPVETWLAALLRAAGWFGSGSAFYGPDDCYASAPNDWSALTTTARIVWCLYTAKVFEDQGD